MVDHLGLTNSNVTYVPVDFERDSLNHELEAAGFDRGAPTLVVWEGVTNYLSAEAVAETYSSSDGSPLREARSSSPISMPVSWTAALRSRMQPAGYATSSAPESPGPSGCSRTGLAHSWVVSATRSSRMSPPGTLVMAGFPLSGVVNEALHSITSRSRGSDDAQLTEARGEHRYRQILRTSWSLSAGVLMAKVR